MNPSTRKYFLLLFAAATLVYFFGLLIEVMEVDAAQYASISREMDENHSYLEVMHRGQNYLDKPPLLFWLSSFFIQMFGANSFAYKLPSFLVTLLGVYSTFRLAKKLYSETAGWMAAGILYTCQSWFTFNNDVRSDTLLAGFVIFATWQLYEFLETKKWLNFFFGFTGAALAMMAKGPIGIVVPAAAILSQIMVKKEWKKILWWQWYAGCVWLLLLLSPMILGLYHQYGTEGVKFFFWTQSFGRITGENVWENDAGYLFFTHTFLWAFLPWPLLAMVAFINHTKEVWKRNVEALTWGGFVLPFVALSFSHYKLPHYIFVVLPFAAIMLSGFIERKLLMKEKLLRVLATVHFIAALLLLAGIAVVCIYFFPLVAAWKWIIFGLLAFLAVWFFRSSNPIIRLVFPSAIGIIAVNFLMNIHFYPQLLQYQAGTRLAEIAIAKKIPSDKIYFSQWGSHSFEFYFGAIIPSVSEGEIKAKAGSGIWVLGGDELFELLVKNNLAPKQIFEADDYPVSLLTIQFLNPETRASTLKKKYLIQL